MDMNYLNFLNVKIKKENFGKIQRIIVKIQSGNLNVNI